MALNAYHNGRFLSKNEVGISLSDRALFFGDAIYDVAIGKNGKIYQSDMHISRLQRGADFLGFKHKYSDEEIADIMARVVELSKLQEYMIYIQLSRLCDRRIHAAPSECDVSLLVYADEFKMDLSHGQVKLISMEDRRYSYCNVKTTNLLPAVIASTNAERCGCDETVFVRSGFVTECAHSNISILKDGILLSHPTDEKILAGITRRTHFDIAREIGIHCVERPCTFSELMGCDEAIITSTTRLGRTVRHIDGVKIGGRAPEAAAELTARLAQKYEQAMKNG